VFAADRLRQLTMLNVTAPETTEPVGVTPGDLPAPTYVVVAEGTPAGVTLRPVFVGSADRFSDPRWTRPLIAVSGTALTDPGALVFSLEGQFIGPAVVGADGAFAIAAAAEVIAAATQATAGFASMRDMGLSFQPLTTSLSQVLRTTQGVVISSVADDSPAAGVLRPTDVLTTVDGVPVRHPDDAVLRLARAPHASTLQLGIVRNGQPQTIPFQVDSNATNETDGVGSLVMERVAREGARITQLGSGTALAAAGLRRGDIVIQAGDVMTPTPQEVTAAIRDGLDGHGVMLVVRREDGDRVIAVSPLNAR
jgi:S1-C subfamily serine protease